MTPEMGGSSEQNIMSKVFVLGTWWGSPGGLDDLLNITANCHQTRNKNPTPNPLQYQKLILFFPPLRGGVR
jgi:hypothetical protein